jgi:uncharacterized tellurite resistance protein B-like protein
MSRPPAATALHPWDIQQSTLFYVVKGHIAVGDTGMPAGAYRLRLHHRAGARAGLACRRLGPHLLGLSGEPGMFKRLKEILAPPPPPEVGKVRHSFEERQLAAAALLVEAARLDQGFAEAERSRIEELVVERFGLAPDEAADLVAEAEQMAADSVQWQGFTRAIKDGFDYDERVEIIEMLWEVAYADGELHDFEASLIRRITGLLYVADCDSGEARKRVLARSSLS